MGKLFKRLMVLVGLAAVGGYLAGILTAPKAGRETRDDMRRAAKTGGAEVERQLRNISSELADLLDEARRRGSDLGDQARRDLDDLSIKARIARDKAREVVTAVQEGDAKDDDLRLAVTQANLALNHLREYLKK